MAITALDAADVMWYISMVPILLNKGTNLFQIVICDNWFLNIFISQSVILLPHTDLKQEKIADIKCDVGVLYA